MDPAPPANAPWRRIRAVTFDFWNTLIHEGPSGLVAPRVAAWADVLEAAGYPVKRSDIAAAHADAFASYQRAWLANEQYVVADATATMLSSLGLSVAPAVEAALVDAFTTAGHRSDLQLCPGVERALPALRERGIALSIVCDIGLTPSPVLRRHLQDRSLLGLFASWAFSDEVGVYKPDRRLFLHALAPLGVEPGEAVHVGDRYRTDVAGAKAVGMAAVFYNSIYDDADEPVEADAVIGDHEELLALLDADVS